MRGTHLKMKIKAFPRVIAVKTVTEGQVGFTVSKTGHDTTSGTLTIAADTEAQTITLPITV